MKKVSVLVIEDHPVVTMGIELILEGVAEFTIVAKAEDPHQAIECVNHFQPDIVILDLSLGGHDGLALIKRIHGIRKTTRILVFSSSNELTYGVRSIRAGASGYLMKKEGLEELLIAVKRIHQGQTYLSERLRSLILEKNFADANNSTSEFDSEIDQLSDRELQILQFIGKGYTTGKIAETLHLSPKTISSHKENIKIKFGINSAADILRKAITLSEKNEI